MRYWLEQDYLYLFYYARSFERLASMASNESISTLTDGAHYTLNTELPQLEYLGSLFSTEYKTVSMGKSCRDYTNYLETHARDYDSGIISLIPCMMGFAVLGLSITPPEEPRYRRWLEIYSAADFQGYTDQYSRIVNNLTISHNEAKAIFVQGIQHEISFWDEAYQSVEMPAGSNMKKFPTNRPDR